MRRIILSSVACLALQKFPTFSLERHDFRDTFIENKMFFFIFSANLSKHFSFLEKFRGILPEMYFGLHVKYPLLLSDFN